MKKDALVKKYAEKHNLSQRQAEAELDKFGDFIVECVETEGSFKLPQVLEIAKVKENKTEVVNPQTQQRVANPRNYKIKTKVFKRILDLRV